MRTIIRQHSTSSSTGLLQMPLPFIHRLLPQMNGFFHLSCTHTSDYLLGARSE